MRTLFYLAALLIAPLLIGCQTHTCDGRGESEICEIHHIMMESQLVKRPKEETPSQAYLAARVRYFRHSYPFVLPKQCDDCVVYVCPECVQTEQQWLLMHPNQK